MTAFKIGDTVRAPMQRHYTGTIVAVYGEKFEVEWNGLAARVRKRIVPADGIEHIPPPPSVSEAERGVVRAAMEWFTAEDQGYEADRLTEACGELQDALQRQGTTKNG
jgi:hypothetical protein